MRIAIDGMGGDNAPQAVINGVIQALNEYNDLEFYITGPEDIIKEQLTKEGYTGNKIIVVDAKEVISTNEHPVMAIRKKKDSSLCKALNLVKDKTCDAVLSAGSTGAFLAGCNFIVGRIKGVKRPALTPIMPGKNGPFIVVDAGANVDCKPEYLLQFAHMGKEYYKGVLNSENPSIGLVNIGAEEEKGNDLTKNTYQLLKNEKIIRNKLKINATINNSKIFKKIQNEYGTFHNYLKTFTNDVIIYEIDKTTNQLSDDLSKDLQKRGMKFVGSTIIYSYLQAIGIIYSHDKECFMYKNN